MIIAIDESGTHRQSGYSVIALICIADIDKLARLDAQIEALEKAVVLAISIGPTKAGHSGVSLFLDWLNWTFQFG